MNVFHSIDEIAYDKNTCLTVGTFDGVHLGHQKIINEMIFRSVENSCRNLVITFHPHPQIVLAKSNNIKILSTLEQKLEYFRLLLVQNVLLINFTKEFSEINFKEFVEEILLRKIGLHTIVVGKDHHFGKNREGNSSELKRLSVFSGFNVIEVEPLTFGESKISSTKIRQALLNGDIENASKMLGKRYEIRGKVIRGDMRGQKIGFPTANIIPDDIHKLIPAKGVYLVEVDVKKNQYYGMMNIGTRPTFNNATDIIMEVHIFYFNDDIYNEPISVRFIDRIRDEQKFGSIEELKNQLIKDREFCFNKIESLKIFSD